MHKNYLLIIFVLSFIVLSCHIPKPLAVQGTNYPKLPILVKSDKSFEDVWGNIIDLFAQNGISIKIIDKSSGIIISDKTEFISTTEDDNNNIVNPDAHIVVGHKFDPGSNKYVPINRSLTHGKNLYPIYGEWNIRVKMDGNECIVNVNIVNLTYDEPQSTSINSSNVFLVSRKILPDFFRTTGVFENKIAEIIK